MIGFLLTQQLQFIEAIDSTQNILPSIPGFNLSSFINIFKSSSAFHESLKIGLDPERLAILKALPAYSFFFDFRVIVSVIATAAVIFYFIKPKSKALRTIRINIRIVALALLIIKYVFSATLLIFSKNFFFTYSNVFFGSPLIHLFFFALDLILMKMILMACRKEHYVIIGGTESILTSTNKFIDSITSQLSSKKTMIEMLVLPILGFLLVKIGLKTNIGKGITDFFMAKSQDGMYTKPIGAFIYAAFLAPKTQFSMMYDRFFGMIFEKIVQANIFIISYLVNKLKGLIKIAIGAFVINRIILIITAKIIKITADILNFIRPFYKADIEEVYRKDRKFETN